MTDFVDIEEQTVELYQASSAGSKWADLEIRKKTETSEPGASGQDKLIRYGEKQKDCPPFSARREIETDIFLVSREL